MEKITLTVGDKLIPVFSSTISHFEVLSIDRPNNSLKVRCVSLVNGYSHEEHWDDLDVTEKALEIGEYVLI